MSATATAEPTRHVPALDGLRGIAVLLVIAFHLVHLERATSAFESVLLFPMRLGWSGVDLFFVLSGFLITGLLLDAKGKEGYFRVFYARRALRIFPLYYVTLAVLFILFHAFAPVLAREDAARPAWYWLYASNVLMARKGFPAVPLSHFWSLAIEEQFYLAWPLVVRLLSLRALGVLAGAIVVVVPLARTALFLSGASILPLYVLTPFRLDALAVGALAVILYRSAARTEVRRGAAAAFAVGFVALVGLLLFDPNPLFFAPAMVTIGYTLLAVTFAGALLLAATSLGFAARLLSTRFLTATGRVSYAMYIFHWPVIWVLRAQGLAPGEFAATTGSRAAGALLYAGAAVAAIYALAFASWFLLEKRCLALKDRIRFGVPSPT